MKERIILFFLLCVISSTGRTQVLPFVNIYAYSQAVLGGANPQGVIEEGGKEIKESRSGKLNYYFYAEYLPGTKFTITSVWIKGQRFAATIDTIRQTPVKMEDTGMGVSSQKTVLVPSTRNNVLLLIPGGLLKTSSKPANWLQKMLTGNELVVACKWKGKIWYYTVPKIKLLDTIAGV